MNLLIDKHFRKTVPKGWRESCQKKIAELAEALESGLAKAFLEKNDGKQMRGAKSIYKFRANKSDRIIYTHTNDVPHLREHAPNSIVLLRYTVHDEQGTIAVRIDLNMVTAEKIQVKKEYLNDFHFTDETTTEDADRYLHTMVSNIVNIDQLKDYLSSDNDNYDVLLNREQYAILEQRSLPMILYGCAGSGKTILSLHILFQQLAYSSQTSGLYMSLSANLNNKAKDLFSNICTTGGMNLEKEGGVSFADINQLLIKKLGYRQTRFVKYSDFENVFCTDINRKQRLRRLQISGITNFDLWSEIRGILKGHLDESWAWNKPILNSKLNDNGIRFLLKHGLIINTDTMQKKYRKTNDSETVFHKAELLLTDKETMSNKEKEEILSAAKTVDMHFEIFDGEKRMLSLEEYLLLNEEYSVYSEEERRQIFDICEQYDAWLQDSHYYDDNDLARGYLVSQDRLSYDFIVTDEVQDLTEMQIYALINMSGNASAMMYAGDIHQVINPTYFSEERIRKLYYLKYKQRVDTKSLKKNFRSQDKIVDFSNDMSALRKKRIGSRSLLSEVSEESVVEGWKPMILNPSPENIKRIVNRINELAYAGIVVQDEETVERLRDLLSGDYNGVIYTIQEIKGLERKYILCFNMASAYSSAWQDIFSDKDIRRNVKYRYFFNTLYVGVTRAQEYLCFIEENIPDEMAVWLESYGERIEEFDDERLFLLDEANADESWYHSAARSEKNEDYERAIRQYKRSAVKDYEYCIKRCTTKSLLQKRRDKQAMEYYFDNQDKTLLDIIKNSTDNEEISGLCEKINLMLYNGRPLSYESLYALMDQLIKYKGGDKMISVLLNAAADNTWLKLMDLHERLTNEVKQ